MRDIVERTVEKRCTECAEIADSSTVFCAPARFPHCPDRLRLANIQPARGRVEGKAVAFQKPPEGRAGTEPRTGERRRRNVEAAPSGRPPPLRGRVVRLSGAASPDGGRARRKAGGSRASIRPGRGCRSRKRQAPAGGRRGPGRDASAGRDQGGNVAGGPSRWPEGATNGRSPRGGDLFGGPAIAARKRLVLPGSVAARGGGNPNGRMPGALTGPRGVR